MTKGYHKQQWFIDNILKVIINTRNANEILVQSRDHAKQLFLIQNLNQIKYVKKEI